MTSNDYGDINHAIGLNFISIASDKVVAMCTCRWTSDAMPRREAQAAGQAHLAGIRTLKKEESA